jgi:SAM-dependent methyltransferase
MTDHYERSAEFVDVMLAPQWTALGTALAEALRAAPGPVADIGAGGGHGTRVIARAVLEADIFAVEPSPGLRALLMARVHENPELRDRVTVLPSGLLQATLPPHLGAVVAMNVIGHFSPTDRHTIWTLLGERLLRDGRAVLNLQPSAELVAVPQPLFSELRIGRRRYEGWGRAEPAGPDQITRHMTYRTFQDGEPAEEAEVSYDWWVTTEDQLIVELAEHGLHAPPPARPTSVCGSSRKPVTPPPDARGAGLPPWDYPACAGRQGAAPDALGRHEGPSPHARRIDCTDSTSGCCRTCRRRTPRADHIADPPRCAA